MVRAFLLTLTVILPSKVRSRTSPSEIRRCSFVIASDALETISRKKISLSEYSQRLMMGNIFSVSTDYLLGVEKTSTIDISGLSEQDIEMIYTLAEYLKSKNRL